ncbi:TNF receptor superfamily member 1A S homeolog precursor [Xenopus laevis]|uniref:TNF receptor superfamily member 1A S homeolog precursor n=2 Tax=Xenopus laevis TaxID=8355 RepID=A9CPG4_XENLA|nr:TNF receptor superfamily member 1A S homeolog precursor [Xenopus laevis]OCT69808.1 hypothetical protein XELAEV_18036733mg [Xenopus laevis]BAF95748.1 tumor necrosis factor receptor 1 [Xenopus laevis]
MIGHLMLMVLWLGVIPSYSIDVPLPAAILVKGEPVGITSLLNRQRRSHLENVTEEEKCADDEYKHPELNHCCKKCLAGFYRTVHCPEKNQVTQCRPCRTGTFTEVSNSITRCRRCSPCTSQHGHVIVKNCTQDKDTVCGCHPGQFQFKVASTFICKNCSHCLNGTVSVPCNGYNDTICTCHFGFYFDRGSRKCLSCDICNDPTCRQHCPPASGLVNPPQENHYWLYALLGLLSVICLAGVTLFIVRSNLKKCIWNTYKVPPPSNMTDPKSQSESPLLNKTEGSEPVNSISGNIIHMGECVQVTEGALCKSLPLPDVTQETRHQCFQDPVELYTLVDSIPMPRWKEFARRLGLSDNDIERSETDNRRYRDAQYDMLLTWKERVGRCGAKRDAVCKVLREMELAACIEKIQDCL